MPTLAVEPQKYEALHLKYRPVALGDLVGQETVKSTLLNAVQNNRIAPAYMFCGTRGSGKTSAARALAKSLNCLSSDRPTIHPCNTCASCKGISNGSDIDVIELDAASNNGVDDIREVIERANFSPVRGRYKFILIDECHELSSRASNALLKTLEEPPGSVVFVLATTDPQKVLETIKSRCQVHTFKRLAESEIVEHIEGVCRLEKIQAEPDALVAIAQKSEGGLRNALTILAKLAEIQPITADMVESEGGGVPEALVLSCLKAVFKKDMQTLTTAINSLLEKGYEPSRILETMIRIYRDLAVLKISPTATNLYTHMDHYKAMAYIANGWSMEMIYKGLDTLMQGEYQLAKTAYPRLWAEVTLIRLGGLDATLSTHR